MSILTAAIGVWAGGLAEQPQCRVVAAVIDRSGATPGDTGVDGGGGTVICCCWAGALPVSKTNPSATIADNLIVFIRCSLSETHANVVALFGTLSVSGTRANAAACPQLAKADFASSSQHVRERQSIAALDDMLVETLWPVALALLLGRRGRRTYGL
jgi:hypothetical protein